MCLLCCDILSPWIYFVRYIATERVFFSCSLIWHEPNLGTVLVKGEASKHTEQFWVEDNSKTLYYRSQLFINIDRSFDYYILFFTSPLISQIWSNMLKWISLKKKNNMLKRILPASIYWVVLLFAEILIFRDKTNKPSLEGTSEFIFSIFLSVAEPILIYQLRNTNKCIQENLQACLR